MGKATMMVVAALGLVAGCTKAAVDTTTTTNGTMTAPNRLTGEDVRAELLRERPSVSDQIKALAITIDDGVVTVRGSVEDESTHHDLVNRVRAMSAVRGVRDEIIVEPRFLESHNPAMVPPVGSTTTTGADLDTNSGQDRRDVQGGRR